MISRNVAYHGTPQGALSITGIPAAKEMFEPLVPGAFKVPNTNHYRAPEHLRDDAKAFGQWAADRIAEAIEFEGPDTVAAVFLEPVQNSGGCFPPPPGYFQRVREICDEYDVLLVSDEVICAFGRIGSMFACDDFGYVPDIITCAKGMTSGYSPIGAMIASDRLFEPFRHGTTSFPHGYTFGGHPVSSAVAMANLDIFEREGLNDHVKENAPAFRASLESLLDLPIVGDVRGEGYFYGIELVKDKGTRETFDEAESERLLRGYLSKALFDAGLYCRADDRGDPVVQLAPPLDHRAHGVRRHHVPAPVGPRGCAGPHLTCVAAGADGILARWPPPRPAPFPTCGSTPSDDPREREQVEVVDELTNLQEYLRVYRLTLRLKTEGLTPEQLATRSVPPSSMSLLGPRPAPGQGRARLVPPARRRTQGAPRSTGPRRTATRRSPARSATSRSWPRPSPTGSAKVDFADTFVREHPDLGRTYAYGDDEISHARAAAAHGRGVRPALRARRPAPRVRGRPHRPVAAQARAKNTEISRIAGTDRKVLTKMASRARTVPRR